MTTVRIADGLEVELSNAEAVQEAINLHTAALMKKLDEATNARNVAEKLAAEATAARDVAVKAEAATRAKLDARSDSTVVVIRCDACTVTDGKGDPKCAVCSGEGHFDAADQARATLAADLRKARGDSMRARIDLEHKAIRVLGDNAVDEIAKLDDLQVMRKVILHRVPRAKLDGQSAEYIAARFDHVIENEPRPIDLIRMAIDPVPGPGAMFVRADDRPTSPEDARARMINNYPANRSSR